MIGVSGCTSYRWRKGYGGLRVDQASKFKSLEKENAWLKKLVADLSLDNAIMICSGVYPFFAMYPPSCDRM